jgi:NAD(P)-dependent dehydrogenase (short-subunit alcohol dehydrogenase family)
METETELFERHTRVNQLGCFLGMKAVVPLMEQSGGGSIVNISSVAGLRGSPGAIAYSATKWALRGMTKAAAIDLAPRKIRVNSVHPGPIDTEMLEVRTPEQNRQRLQLVPMKRMGTADEVASLVCSAPCRGRRFGGTGRTSVQSPQWISPVLCIGRSGLSLAACRDPSIMNAGGSRHVGLTKLAMHGAPRDVPSASATYL